MRPFFCDKVQQSSISYLVEYVQGANDNDLSEINMMLDTLTSNMYKESPLELGIIACPNLSKITSNDFME